MRNTRSVIACGLLAAATLMAMWCAESAATTRPHPLFGKPILGNSAEIVTMWPMSGNAPDSLRITDYNSVAEPDVLVIKPSHPCAGGPTDPKYQQLDVVAGDFDDDGRDDLVSAYSKPTSDPWLQSLELVVADVDGATLGMTGNHVAMPGLLALEHNTHRSPSNVRMVAGNFDTTSCKECEEFVLATRVPSGFHGALDASDWFGTSAAPIGDLNGDGTPDLAAGSTGDDDGGTERGAVWILFMNAAKSVQSQQKISDTQGGFTGVLDNSDHFGGDVASLGDLDGDAVPDLAVGCYGDDDGGVDRGAVWILFMNANGTVKGHTKISSTSGGFSGALGNDDRMGFSVEGLGDLDGDGVPDLAAGAIGTDVGGSYDRGAVWILFLNANGTVKTQQKIASGTGGFTGALDAWDQLGFGIARPGDLNGDGVTELAVGSLGDDDGGTDRGAVWILFMNASGTVQSLQKISQTSGGFGGTLANDDRMGTSVESIGDLDGDGVADLAVGAMGTDLGGSYDRGAVWILFLNANGTVKWRQKIASDAGSFTGTLDVADYLGYRIASLGDLDSDGRPELAVGAYGDDDFATDAGALWILSLNPTGTVASWKKQGGDVRIALMRLDASRQPQTLATALVQYQDDGLVESTRFDVAAGDFDGDGIDEIVVGGIRRRTNGNMELFVKIYAYDGASLTLKAETFYGDRDPALGSNGEGYFYDHFAIATGNLRSSSLTDQIVISWELRYEDWYAGSSGCFPGWDWVKWDGVRSAGLQTLTVNTAGTWQIAGWDVDFKWKTYSEHTDTGCVLSPSPPYDKHLNGSSLGLAVGDLTGDGIDEVVWAAIGYAWVYQVDPTDQTLAERASVTRAFPWRDPARRVVAIADLDATMGTPWRAEIVLQDWAGASTTQRIRVFRADANGAGVITSLTPLSSMSESQVPMTQGDVALVAGDFNGDGFRLGPPLYRRISDVVQPIVILGSPPVHFDAFESDTFDVNGCYPGDGTYTCGDFKAQYSQELTSGLEVSVENTRDWGLSAELKTHGEAFGFEVEASLKGTYGENFSRTMGRNSERTYATAVNTVGRDLILADRVNYDLWEYPVRTNGGQVIGHMAVIDPGSQVIESAWQPYEDWVSQGGGTAIPHEPGNALSYRKDVLGDDAYGEGWKAEMTGYTVSSPTALAGESVAIDCTAPYCFDLTWTDIDTEVQNKQWKAGVEVGATVGYEYEDPLGQVKVGASIEVNGNYSTSELSTHNVKVGEAISMRGTLGTLAPNIAASYKVWPYVYRSETAGCLVLDYRVDLMGSFWNARYGSAPDLTFILPRLQREAKGDTTDSHLKYISPDIRVLPWSASVGDIVTIHAMVRNYSLVNHSGPVTVRFYAGDPDGAHYPIVDVDLNQEFVITGGIPAREGRSIEIEWLVPSFIPADVKIFARVDPSGDVAEIHENNNKGFALFHAAGVHSTDAPPQVAGVPFRLEQSAPNPFRGSTRIAFGLPSRSRVELEVFDIAGRSIATIVNGELRAGRHEVRWDGRARDGRLVAPGVYLYRIQAGSLRDTRRLVRLD